MLTFEQIKELIEQVADHGLQCLEVERSGFRLKIEGQPAASPAPGAETWSGQSAPQGVSTSASNPDAQPARSASPAGAEPPPEQPDKGPPAGTHVLNSPIVGTFYRRPSPGADPFVQVGSRIEVGKVLCIVEAMKLMNEIESDVDGEIVEIYPENGQPVEYGEPLFAIKAD